MSATTFCWFTDPIPSPPTEIVKARFCQKMLLYSSGNETVVQVPLLAAPEKWFGGHTTEPGRLDVMFTLFWIATRPAGCGVDEVGPFADGQLPSGLRPPGHGPWLLANGAPSVLNSMPEDAVVSLDMIVLFTMSTNRASCSEMPAPSQPATLLVMILLVTVTWYQLSPAAHGVACGLHRVGAVGNVSTSVPLTPCSRSPPPLPLSAPLPMIRLALITSFGPTPSEGAVIGCAAVPLFRQSWSV